MADKYKDYLAANVLNDGKIVTYRSLSRALKVHVNVAKQMLFDFHHKQNAKKPNSVHATYLITGKKIAKPATQANGIHSQDGEDSFMRSSPFMSSMPEASQETVEEPTLITSIILVREEELEDTKAQLAETTSIHVYSLEPGPIENMNMLSLCNQEIIQKYGQEDPMERWKTYGTIHNPHIKKRTTKYAPPAASTARTTAPKVAARPSTGAQAKTNDSVAAPARRDGESEGIKSTPQPESSNKTMKKTDTKPTLKRDKSDIFKSFAKAKPKQKKADAESSKEATPAPEDETMQGMSEDEEEQDYTPEVEISKEKAEAARKKRAESEERKRKDREALEKMMEADSEEDVVMNDAPAEEVEDAPLDKQPTPEPEPTVITAGGRRRGRRRVMKKKTVKDEEGYLVTKEEPVWESFSEDEPEPKKLKPAPSKPTNTAKGKKGPANKQGSIASFFSKK